MGDVRAFKERSVRAGRLRAPVLGPRPAARPGRRADRSVVSGVAMRITSVARSSANVEGDVAAVHALVRGSGSRRSARRLRRADTDAVLDLHPVRHARAGVPRSGGGDGEGARAGRRGGSGGVCRVRGERSVPEAPGRRRSVWGLARSGLPTRACREAGRSRRPVQPAAWPADRHPLAVAPSHRRCPSGSAGAGRRGGRRPGTADVPQDVLVPPESAPSTSPPRVTLTPSTSLSH